MPCPGFEFAVSYRDVGEAGKAAQCATCNVKGARSNAKIGEPRNGVDDSREMWGDSFKMGQENMIVHVREYELDGVRLIGQWQFDVFDDVLSSLHSSDESASSSVLCRHHADIARKVKRQTARPCSLTSCS